MLFKERKLGQLVGTRTFGGMIGAGATYEITWGGGLVVAEFGFYSEGIGWSPENFGVEPDYVVELKPPALTGGRNPQLEKAIELAMEALKAYTKAATPPAYQSGYVSHRWRLARLNRTLVRVTSRSPPPQIVDSTQN